MPKANFETGLKLCPKCEVEKPIDQFFSCSGSKDGLQGFCKSCGCLAMKNWYENNKDKMNQHKKIYYENNKDKKKQYYEINKGEIKQYAKNYRKTNKDKIKLANKNWREVNRNRIKKYYEINKDKIKQYTRNKYEKRKEFGLCVDCGSQLMGNSKSYCEKCWFKHKSYSAFGSSKHWKHLKNLFEQQGHKCHWTMLDLVLGINASVDHIKPRSEYPELARDPNNICWCDDSINCSKQNRDPDEFKKELDIQVFYDKKLYKQSKT